MSGYARETLGIKPWPGASITHVTRGYVGTAYQVGDVLVYGMIHKDARGFRFDWHDEATIDLLDPDTLAAFDRRLALRLGAPEEAVREGVIVQLDGGYLSVFVGMVECRIDASDYLVPERDVAPVVDLKTDCPILARIRAWRSVK